jgi:TRAP-type C4-dicarboxylate transport system substrate-binding protein
VRAGVRAALAEATAAQRGFAQADDVTCLARLAEAGSQVLELAAPERAAFAAPVAPVGDAARARLDPGVLDLLRTAA